MKRLLHYVSEGEIRDYWYAELTNYFSGRADSISIPEMWVGGRGRADLVTYVCWGELCGPLFLFEFKSELGSGRRITHSKVRNQALRYSAAVDPEYTVSVDLTSSMYLTVYQRGVVVEDRLFHSYAGLFNYFFSVFLPSARTSRFTVPRENVIGEVLRPPTYERFLRAEFARILNGRGLCAIPECSSVSAPAYRRDFIPVIVKPDLVIYGVKCCYERQDCDYPLLVLEFKSQYDLRAVSQAENYRDSLLPHFYGTVYGMGKSVEVEVRDREGAILMKRVIPMGDPHLREGDVVGLIRGLSLHYPPSSLPQVPPLTPLNGRYDIGSLVEMGAKVSRFKPDLSTRYLIPGFSVFLDRDGVRYPDHDYSIVVDCPAKLTRLVLFDPDRSLEWCEFSKGELIRCNRDVIVAMISEPCSRLIDKLYP